MECELLCECENNQQIVDACEKLDKAVMCKLDIDVGGSKRPVDNFMGIYNVSKGKMSGATVPHYNLVQHKDYFLNFSKAMDRLNLKYKMTIAQSGGRAFADIDFIDNNVKFDKLNEEFATGLRLINSYDKSSGVAVIPKYTRLACTNGMILTRHEKTLAIKHHSKIVKELEKFIESKISDFIGKNEQLKRWVSESMGDSIEWETVCLILEKAFKQPKHRGEILKKIGISIISIVDQRTKKKRVSYVWDNDDDKKAKLTRWEIYNAITSYLTHGEHITPHIQNLFHRKAEKILTVPLLKLPKAEKQKLA